jgi:hypothetical protein
MWVPAVGARRGGGEQVFADAHSDSHRSPD